MFIQGLGWLDSSVSILHKREPHRVLHPSFCPCKIFAALFIEYLNKPLAPEYPLALFGAIARRHVGRRVDIKSASRFDDLVLVYALKVERQYGSFSWFVFLRTWACCYTSQRSKLTTSKGLAPTVRGHFHFSNPKSSKAVLVSTSSFLRSNNRIRMNPE